ncbi:MAG: hypothetical protein EBR34_08140 [Sphingomonadaceae bacterium]|nr:hypothetical protein [Sphingomonadaceae bacterium]
MKRQPIAHNACPPPSWSDGRIMKMGFAIKPELLSGVEASDKVAFEIDWDGQKGKVTAIRRTE